MHFSIFSLKKRKKKERKIFVELKNIGESVEVEGPTGYDPCGESHSCTSLRFETLTKGYHPVQDTSIFIIMQLN